MRLHFAGKQITACGSAQDVAWVTPVTQYSALDKQQGK
jgi:hypothetical protein